MNNTKYGSDALQNNLGINNTGIIGTNTGVTGGGQYDYSTAIGVNSQIRASNQIMLGGYNSGVYPQIVVPGGITGGTMIY